MMDATQSRTGSTLSARNRQAATTIAVQPETRPRERRMRHDREHVEAVRLMQVVRMHEGRYPELRWLFHVPNGGARNKVAAGKLKAEGVRRGVPDYLWPIRSECGDVGLAIELKAQGGRLEPEQRQWIAHLSGQGWRCVVAYGWAEAWEAVCDYAGYQNRVGVGKAP